MDDIGILSSIIRQYTGRTDIRSDGKRVPYRAVVHYGRTTSDRGSLFPVPLDARILDDKGEPTTRPLEPEECVQSAERIVARMRDHGASEGEKYWLIIFLVGESNDADSTPGLLVPPPMGGWPPKEDEGGRGKRRDREVKRLEDRIDELNKALKWSENMRFNALKQLDEARMDRVHARIEFADKIVASAELTAKALKDSSDAVKDKNIAELNFATAEKLASERLLDKGLQYLPLLGGMLKNDKDVSSLSGMPPRQRAGVACSAIGSAIDQDGALLLDDELYIWFVKQTKILIDARLKAGKPIE